MYLQETTKKNIEYIVGLPLDHIQSLTLDDEISHVETRTGQSLRWPVMAYGFNTGNPLLNLGRYRTMEDVDKQLDKMFPIHIRFFRYISKLTQKYRRR